MSEEHPFRAAWRTRELDPWIAALSPEVVLRSPVLTTPFTGRARARELFGVLFQAFGPMEIIGEFSDAGLQAFFWRLALGGRLIEGTDLLRYDSQGLIAEVTVFIRPLPDLGLFASAIGPRLAANMSPTRGALVRLLVQPLKALLAVADAASTRLLGSRQEA